MSPTVSLRKETRDSPVLPQGENVLQFLVPIWIVDVTKIMADLKRGR